MSKTLVIFDIDGTLLFSNKEDSRIFARAFRKEFGFEAHSIDWHEFPHVTDTTILEVMFKKQGVPFPSVERLEEFKDYYVEMLLHRRVQNPENFLQVEGAQAAVHSLVADDRYLVGIATGGFRKPAFVKLDHVGINTESLFMSFADGNHTREQIIEGVFRQVETQGEAVSRSVYIGDAIWDVRTTRNMDLPFIGIQKPGKHDMLYRAGAKHVISDYKDYQGFLNLIENATPPLPQEP
ncbi:MAG: HAD hydrolase-like protein [Bacteroidota bacterium]